jgi:hypothetical protein
MDGNHRANSDFCKAESALVFCDYSVHKDFEAIDLDLGAFGNGAEGRNVAGRYRSQKQMFGGPQAGFATEFRRGCEIHGARNALGFENAARVQGPVGVGTILIGIFHGLPPAANLARLGSGSSGIYHIGK